MTVRSLTEVADGKDAVMPAVQRIAEQVREGAWREPFLLEAEPGETREGQHPVTESPAALYSGGRSDSQGRGRSG